MGKWKAEHIVYGQWHVTKDDMVIAYRADATEAQIFTEPQATRYALALNIVDAGVDFGEFKELLGEWGALETWFNNEDEVSRLVVPHDLYHRIKVLFSCIANAVEGDTTKEDV